MKNWTLRVGVILVALTLITSCFVGGTFAKYVTAGTGTDTARVAKFGVEVTGEGTMFAQSYNDTGSVTVSSDVKVVAPGTSGTMVNYAITGTPEVAVNVSYSAVVTVNDWELDGTFYCPIIIKNNGVQVLCGLDYTSAADFKAALEAYIGSLTTSYEPGADLSGAGNVYTLSWQWNFESTDGIALDQSDANDTLLGNKAADGTAPTITIETTCTVTQID